jgi:hypothetical protein
MAVEWLSLLSAHGIEYVTTGPNVGPGFIAVHCPFCGPADPSQHMTVRLNGRGWRCWRHPDHRGTNPAYLLAALLGVPMAQAQALIGPDTLQAIPEDWFGQVKATFEPQDEAPEVLELPPEFKRIVVDSPSARRHVDYLRGRGFRTVEIMRFSDWYDIRYASMGDYKGRAIFLVFHQRKLIAWTGRSIYPNAFLRYDSEGELGQTLLWYDRLRRYHGPDRRNAPPHTLVLCEGPFDALKVRVKGRRHGIAATCFFTSAPTATQLDLLHELVPEFKRTFLLLDSSATAVTLRVAEQLSLIGVMPLHLPAKYKDPGELDEKALLALVGRPKVG